MAHNPSANPTPLDLASFYVEALKYGPGPGQVEGATADEIVNQLEVLLRDAGVQSMSGADLLEAQEYYARSLAASFGVPVILTRSLFMDGLMHGIALAGGLVGEQRDPKEQVSCAQAPPALAPKHSDRQALLRDVEYFATELIKRIERLAKIEPDGRMAALYQQAAAMTRRVRGLGREQADRQRRKEKLASRGER